MRVAATRSEGVFVLIAYSSSCHARYRCCGAVFPLPLTELKINIDKLGDSVSLLVAVLIVLLTLQRPSRLWQLLTFTVIIQYISMFKISFYTLVETVVKKLVSEKSISSKRHHKNRVFVPTISIVHFSVWYISARGVTVS